MQLERSTIKQNKQWKYNTNYMYYYKKRLTALTSISKRTPPHSECKGQEIWLVVEPSIVEMRQSLQNYNYKKRVIPLCIFNLQRRHHIMIYTNVGEITSKRGEDSDPIKIPCLEEDPRNKKNTSLVQKYEEYFHCRHFW